MTWPDTTNIQKWLHKLLQLASVCCLRLVDQFQERKHKAASSFPSICLGKRKAAAACRRSCPRLILFVHRVWGRKKHSKQRQGMIPKRRRVKDKFSLSEVQSQNLPFTSFHKGSIVSRVIPGNPNNGTPLW